MCYLHYIFLWESLSWSMYRMHNALLANIFQPLSIHCSVCTSVSYQLHTILFCSSCEFFCSVYHWYIWVLHKQFLYLHNTSVRGLPFFFMHRELRHWEIKVKSAHSCRVVNLWYLEPDYLHLMVWRRNLLTQNTDLVSNKSAEHFCKADPKEEMDTKVARERSV